LMGTPAILSIGEPMAEFCASDLGHLGSVESFKRGWGGDTSNFIVAVARLGGSAGYICRLGGDSFGSSFLDLWAKEGVDASRVIREPNGFTAVYFISLKPEGGHDFTYYRAGASASRYSPLDIDVEYIRGAKALHNSGITLAIGEEPRKASLLAMREAKNHGAITSFDINMRPKLWPTPLARESCEEAFSLSDIVFASMEDMKTLYDIEEPKRAAEKLRELGVGTAVVKHGGEGCLVLNGDDSFTSPGFSVKVIDTTGSGDAFDGAFVLATLENCAPRRVASFANAVGALTATGLGAVAPIPTREQALRLMREQGRD
jgi:2-dehydro-3-deoxygluconokinase